MTSISKAKALKAQNSPLLWLVVVVDMLIGITIVVGLTVMQDVPLNRMVALRASLVGVAPIVVMLLNPLVPSHIKAIFVFWRLRQVLPGHRAFSHHALADVRIDVTKLKKNAGAFPETPKDQNTKWYSLFKKVENDPAIEQVHKQFLLLRDLAMLSILLLICSLIAWGLGLNRPGFCGGTLG